MKRIQKSWQVRHAVSVFFIFMFLAWTFFISQFSPAELVDAIGSRNGYVLSLASAFIGGLSAFIAFPYYLIVLTLGAGGLDPILLGLAAAVGLFLGDSTSYVLGLYGGELLPVKAQKTLLRFTDWVIGKSFWKASAVLFLYGALAPLPNDLLIIPLGLAQYPYRYLMIPLGLGNLVFTTGIAYAGAYGINLLI